MPLNFGYVSTRFAGTDGVSLEAAKWASIMWEGDKHVTHWYSGLSDRQPEISMCVPEAYFRHSENVWINERIWSRQTREPMVTRRIRVLADYLKETLYEFCEQFSIDVMVAENALTIPMHIPLGIAITEFLAETGTPCIAHHHDFYWERTRFSISAVNDYLDMAFPPRLPKISHTVINASAQQQLSLRKGVGSALMPNVFDFEKPAPKIDSYTRNLRADLGLSEDDIFILQPTRIVPRKGIEHAIKLVSMLDNPRCKLVISHDAGDEGYEYQHMIEELAHEEGVQLVMVGNRVSEIRHRDAKGKKMYTLWDLYPHADLVTYPSIYEGFGNALLEAIYFKKPVLVNRYSIFIEDIEPKGFRFPMIDGFITRQVLHEINRLLHDKTYLKEVVDHNYEVAARYYSHSVILRSLRTIVNNLTGWSPEHDVPVVTEKEVAPEGQGIKKAAL